MIEHKFAVGQFVDFDKKLTPSPRPAGPYEVTRVLPAENAETQTYRIKSKAEPFERSAKEYEIVAVDLPPSERAANPARWLDSDPVRRRQATHPFRSR